MFQYVSDERRAKHTRLVAQKSIVLLKNDGILP
jgi:hypothetical protein